MAEGITQKIFEYAPGADIDLYLFLPGPVFGAVYGRFRSDSRAGAGQQHYLIL